jgi:hypothetical protein
MGRRRIPTLLVLIAIVFMIASCKTVAKTSEYTEENYEYVYNLVLDRSRSDAVLNLFINLNEGKEDMIPADYSFLKEYRYRVPGLDRILTNWSKTTRELLVPNFDVFQKFVTELFSSTQKPDCKVVIETGGDSISQYLREQCSAEMVADISAFITDLDVSAWRETAVQYSAWVNTREHLYEEDNPEIKAIPSDDEIREMLSQHLVDLFFTFLSKYETLFRTTPDPEMDGLAASILGLQ